MTAQGSKLLARTCLEAVKDPLGNAIRKDIAEVIARVQFEREMMLERPREGIAKAKAAGKYGGRKPTARAKADDAIRLFQEGKRVAEIAKVLGVGRGSVYRALADAECRTGGHPAS